MKHDHSHHHDHERWWRALLTDNNPLLPFRHLRHIFGILPASPRCKFCHAPYEGTAGQVMKVIGKGPSKLTPQLCRQCETFASNKMGGTEIELTMLFADVRGSTALAEQSSASEYTRLMNRFFVVASEVLVETHALIDKFVGDQVIGLFVPGFAGPHHRQKGVKAALELLRVTGHSDPDGPWISVGVGVHTGIAFVGSIGTKDHATDITAMGDAVNTAARLCSKAEAGELIVSEATLNGTKYLSQKLPKRELSLKGRQQPVITYSISITDS